jgi:hypothetical protein
MLLVKAHTGYRRVGHVGHTARTISARNLSR